MISFEDKTAIVTGAGRGIGAGIAALFADLGARVALVDIEAIDDSRSDDSSRFASYTGDVRDKAFVQQVVGDVVERWGAVDVLVNNAGIIRDSLLENMSEEDWDAVLGVNLKAAFLCCQAVVPHMKARKSGKIVSIISTSWLGNFGQANYSASKGGLVSLTRTLALELAKQGINVNAVSPGPIDSPMTQKLTATARDRLIRNQPMGIMGKADDIANAVCFLASDKAGFITGQVLHVDGGKSCGSTSL